MKTIIIFAAAIVIVLFCSQVYQIPEQQLSVPVHQVAFHPLGLYSRENLHIEPPNDEYSYEGLQLYPIFASTLFINGHEHLGPYLTLQEAMDQKKIVITELTAEQPADSFAVDTLAVEIDVADVNRLFVENISSDTIIILGGEVVHGGNQDRMIAQDFMVFPNSGKIDIDVYCVEHGRWAPAEDEDAKVFQVAEVMQMAPIKIRKAAKSEDHAPQAKVWDEIEKLSEDVNASSQTGALSSAVSSAKMVNAIDPYRKHFENINWPDNVVGIMAVMGTEIIGLDIFAQHKLFIKYYPNLLSSYCSNVYEEDKTEIKLYGQIQTFFTTLIANETTLNNRILEHGTQLKHHGYRIHVATFDN